MPRFLESKVAVGQATLEEVAWFDHQRLPEAISYGYISLAEAKENAYRQRVKKLA